MPGIKDTKKRKRTAVPSKTSKNKPVQKKPRNGEVKEKNGKKIIEIPEQSRQIEQQDEEFFEGDEVGDFSFLRKLDVKILGKRVEKEKIQREERPAKPTAPVFESEDEYSDEEGLSDALGGALEEKNVVKDVVKNWDEEQEYEAKPRTGDSQWRKKEPTKLPIRTPGGAINDIDASESESESSDESEISDSDSEEDEKKEQPVVEEHIKMGPEAVIEAKEALAKLAEEILELPEERVQNLKGFREIFNKGNQIIKKLAMITQLTVYKDIIPGYRIRPVSEAEKTTKISTEVRQLRNFEESILSNYKAFIASLVTTIKSARIHEQKAPLSLVAVTCAASLLTSVPHFNFRTDLLKIVVQQLSRRSADEAFVKCRDAMETLFREDEEGRAALEAVTMISQMVKKRHYKVHPSVPSRVDISKRQVIQSLLHLRLLTELGVKASTDTVENPRLKKKQRVFRTKKERKEFKERKKIEKDLAEADAEVSAEERERVQSDTLKLVFTLYFRILKETEDDATLSVVLDGIAKFARLINAEFFGDLLEVLREILEGWDDDALSTKSGLGNRIREELVCLNTAFTLLANQGGSNIDLSYFVQRFYDLLPDISCSTALSVKPSPGERSLMELVVRIVDAILFTPPTAPPPARIFMFYKRILTCTLNMEEKEVMTFVKMLQRIGGRFEKKVEGMWDQEGAGIGDPLTGRGVRGWEVALLEKFYSSNIAQASKTLWKTESKA